MKFDTKFNTHEKVRLVIYSIIPALVWLLYGIAFFPGLMNADSLYVWEQVRSYNMDEAHTGFLPIFYSWLALFWDSPGVVILVHIGSIFGILCYFMFLMKRLKAPEWLLITISAYFTLSPFIAASMLSAIKDVPFAISVFFLTGLTIETIESKGELLRSVKHVVIMAAILALLFLTRPEGMVPFAVFLICLFYFYRSYWKSICRITALALFFVFLVKGPLFALYHVKRNAYIDRAIMQCAELSVIYNNNGVLTDEQKALMGRIAPMEIWSKWYTPYTQNGVVFTPRFNLETAYKYHKDISIAWRSAVLKNWWLLLKSRIKGGSIVWSIVEPADGYTYAVHLIPVPAGIDDNKMGLHPAHLIPGVEQKLRTLIKVTSGRGFNWLFFRPALYFYIVLAAAAVLCWAKKGCEPVLLAAPWMAHALFVFLIAINQESRFLFYTFLTAPFMVAYAVIAMKNKTKENGTLQINPQSDHTDIASS